MASRVVASAMALALVGCPPATPPPASQPTPPLAATEPPPAPPARPRFVLQTFEGELPEGLTAGAVAGEYVNDKDGSILVWVPPGSFVMGYDRGDEDEDPAHRVHLTHGYFMSRYEVTRAQWAAFCDATEQAPPTSGRDDHPMTGVSWFDACDYAEWAGLRLPTEAEWEFAGRGEDGRLFPWGGWLDQPPANVTGSDDGFEGIAPVGSLVDGASSFGCFDLVGNAEEWVYDRLHLYPWKEVRDPTGSDTGDTRVLRGGSHSEGARRLTSRRAAPPVEAPASAGFRLCRSSPSGGPALVVARRPKPPVEPPDSPTKPRRLPLGEWVEGVISFRSYRKGDSFEAWHSFQVTERDSEVSIHQELRGSLDFRSLSLYDPRMREFPWSSSGGGRLGMSREVTNVKVHPRCAPGTYFVGVKINIGRLNAARPTHEIEYKFAVEVKPSRR